MRIAIIRKKYTFHGGAESFSTNFIQKLADEGHEIHIYAINWQTGSSHSNIQFNRVPVLAFNSFLRDLSFTISAYFILKKKRRYYDIIQTHDKTLYQDLYRAGDGCHMEWLRQRWKRTGINGKISIIINPYHLLILALERSIFKRHRYKKIIAISEMVKRNIIENYDVPSEGIEVIYNGVDLNKFHPDNRAKFRAEVRKKHGVSDNAFVVLFVGSGFERKGVKYLIEAVESLSLPLTVMIVGKGSEKKFKKISPNPSLLKRGILEVPLWKRGIKGDFQSKQNIIFCGPQKDIHKYYAAADIFVFPTIYEPFGNVHLEALATGLPVITTKNSGAAEIIRKYEHGFVLDEPEDIDALAAKIKYFLHNKDQLKIMSARSRQLAEEFSHDRHISKIMQLYEDTKIEDKI